MPTKTKAGPRAHARDTINTDPIHIKDLKPDPLNARKHNARNIGMIADALHEVGAARSVVIDENDVILAGNGAIEAAGQAGITKLQVVEADGDTMIAVRRRNLTPAQKLRLAHFDNRTAELAEWDVDVLKQLQSSGANLSNLWSAKELAKLFDEPATPPEPKEATDTGVKYLVLVTCQDESHQSAVLQQFLDLGLDVKAIIA